MVSHCIYLTLSVSCMENFHVKLPRVLQGDGEQLHPDLQRILELELNDYHFLRQGYPGVFTLSYGNPWWFPLDMVSICLYDGFSIPMMIYVSLLMDKPLGIPGGFT